MTLPSKNIEYGTKEYWDHRYSQQPDSATFDWFKSYAEVAHLIREYVPDKSSKILMLGCGNSSLSEDMWQDGYKNIVNIDYSSVVIQQMKQEYGSIRPGMEWHEMDVRALAFGDASFDVAIDKGTMDAMMASEIDVWDPPTQVVEDCTREVHEVMRILPRGGIFLYLTFGQPHFRRRFLSFPDTSLQIREIGEMFHYYLYVLKV